MYVSAAAIVIASMLVVLGFAQQQPAASQPASPLDALRAKLPDPSKPFTLVVEYKLKPGADNYDAFRKLAKAAADGTRREPGFDAYEFHRGIDDPTQVLLFEKWKKFADLEKHFAEKHTGEFIEASKQYLAEPAKLRLMSPMFE
ncbi:MAG: putative quinol monooxygenase [Phycisphaerae bacterium]